MTKIFYREYYDKNLIIIEGHSGYDVPGNDIVCAGVSALVCTLINCLRDEGSADRIHLLRDVVHSGYVCFEVESYDFAKERINGIFDTCMTGFLMLAEHYPQYITME